MPGIMSRIDSCSHSAGIYIVRRCVWHLGCNVELRGEPQGEHRLVKGKDGWTSCLTD